MSEILAQAATSSGALTDLVSAVQADPADVASAVRQRIEASQQSGHVVMMGGWTDSNQ
ncbi:hypothetical protein [Streptomyces sp. NPDC037389]|uniref:hypothetical protein n=1 Tax=Streptomyces sp. NPDC037389 TaxID=3155369 RepID=UPI0033C34D0A